MEKENPIIYVDPSVIVSWTREQEMKEKAERAKHISESKRHCLTCYYAQKDTDYGTIECQYFKKENMPTPGYIIEHYVIHSGVEKDGVLSAYGDSNGWTWEIENCATYRKQE